MANRVFVQNVVYVRRYPKRPLPRRFKLSDASIILTCSTHRSWYQSKKANTLLGYRNGYAAGRRTIQDYVFDQLITSSLSSTGHFDNVCSHCHALLFAAETRRARNSSQEPSGTFCCGNGRLKNLPSLPPAPATLASLLSGRKAEDVPLEWHPFTSAGFISEHALVGWQRTASAAFKQNIRCYNSALGFASFSDALSAGDQAPDEDAAGRASSSRGGPPVYILHGRAYHIVGTFYPPKGEKAKFAQLYVYDPQVATDVRLDSFDGLDAEMLSALLHLLTEEVIHKDPWTGQEAHVVFSVHFDSGRLAQPPNHVFVFSLGSFKPPRSSTELGISCFVKVSISRISVRIHAYVYVSVCVCMCVFI